MIEIKPYLLSQAKPCPFCGGNDLEFQKQYCDDDKDKIHAMAIAITCKRCCCVGRYNYPIGWVESSDHALSSWNDRQGDSLNQNILNWFLNERAFEKIPTIGLSSKAIAFYIVNGNVKNHNYNYPSDPSDFWRCVNLLSYCSKDQVDKFKKMGEVSGEWKGLIESWVIVETSLKEEMKKGDNCPLTYKLMKAILEPHEHKHRFNTLSKM